MKLLQKTALTAIRLQLKVLSLVSPARAAALTFKLFCTPKFRHVKPPSPWFAEATPLTTTYADRKIIGYEWNGDAPKTALIVHGFESSVINFEYYAEELVKKGYRVLAFDGPAHGRSEGKRTNAMEFSGFLQFIIREYGPIQAYVAHSFGGLCLMLALADVEHRATDRIVLIAPATRSVTAASQAFDFLHVNSKRVKREFDNIIHKISGHGLDWFSIDRAIMTIRASILWVHDKDDLVTPIADTIALQNNPPENLQFLITAGLGHRKVYRDPDVGRTIVAYL